MNNNSTQSEKFDSLRAGLHVEDVDFKDSCTPKLIDRENAYWQHIVDGLEESSGNDRGLCNQLRIRRRQVLSGQYSRPRGSGAPRFALGVATGVAAIAAGMLWWNPAPEQAGTEVTRTASIESMSTEHYEFANNIDFYTWLEKQTDTVADSGGG